MARQPASSKKRLKGPERRQEIINSTIELASRRGLRSVRTKEIATESGINEALIFRHFKNKEGLLQAVVQEVTSRRNESLGELAPPRTETEFLATVQRYATFFLKLNGQRPAYLRILLLSILEEFPGTVQTAVPRDDPFLTWLEDSIDRGKNKWGYGKDINPEVAVSGFIGGLIYYFLRTAIMKKEPIDHEVTGKLFAHSFQRSLRGE